jgi:hypothetical protein
MQISPEDEPASPDAIHTTARATSSGVPFDAPEAMLRSTQTSPTPEAVLMVVMILPGEMRMRHTPLTLILLH